MLFDWVLVEYRRAGKAACLTEDYNLDGQLNNPDKNELWKSNDGEESEVPEQQAQR